MTINKNRALFWLGRRVKELESRGADPAHEDMALAGLSYSKRQAVLAEREKAREDVEAELVALREVVALVQEHA